MGYQALLFCPDEKTARTVTQVLTELEFSVEPCTEAFAAVKKLMGGHFDAVVVDYDNEQNAALLFKSAKNSTTSQSKKFKSTYMAEAQYFGGRDDVSTNQRRPKLPFAPLSVAGHGVFTGTILFYPTDAPEKKVVDPMTKIDMTLTVGLLLGTDWFDRFLSTALPSPATIEADVANYVPGVLIGGYIMPLKVKTETL